MMRYETTVRQHDILFRNDQKRPFVCHAANNTYAEPLSRRVAPLRLRRPASTASAEGDLFSRPTDRLELKVGDEVAAGTEELVGALHLVRMEDAALHQPADDALGIALRKLGLPR